MLYILGREIQQDEFYATPHEMNEDIEHQVPSQNSQGRWQQKLADALLVHFLEDLIRIRFGKNCFYQNLSEIEYHKLLSQKYDLILLL